MTPAIAPPPPSSVPAAGGIPNAVHGRLLLTKKQLSDATGLPTRTLERLTANGTIPSLRITSKLLRYELPAVMAALRQYETATLTRKK